VKAVRPKPYFILGCIPGVDNCQSYAERLRRKYYELERDVKVRCECFGIRRNALLTILK
jgi:hypothetical protein